MLSNLRIQPKSGILQDNISRHILNVKNTKPIECSIGRGYWVDMMKNE